MKLYPVEMNISTVRLLKFEKEHLKTVPVRYQTQKNHAGETAADYKVKFIPLSKTESRTDQ